jgi:hypothetical protein
MSVVSIRSVFGAPCCLSSRDLDATQDFYGETATVWQMAVAWTPSFAVANARGRGICVQERGGTVTVGPISFPPGKSAPLMKAFTELPYVTEVIAHG